MQHQLLSISVRLSMALAFSGLAIGCATSDPSVDTSPSAELSFDGLYPVTGSRADAAWARQDIDLSPYTKIMLQGVGIEYRPGGIAGRSPAARSTSGPYVVTETQKERFKDAVREAFQREMARSEQFTLVEEPGPDVLLIRGALLDVVSYVPPEPVGRTDIYLDRVGEATLVLELRDSITEAILARAIDRRAAENRALGLQESNRATNKAEVQRMVRTWARILRTRLDEYKAPPG